VVPTSLFRSLGYFQGFTSEVSRYFPVLLADGHVSFRSRGEVENDSNFKQLIPYMIFSHSDDRGNLSVFQYVRGKGMGEKRLHAKRSVGVGGHISLEDSAEANENQDLYRTGMLRELKEEVDLRSVYKETCVGMINDDETEVGRVHLGIVHRFELERPELTSRETDLIESGFVPVEELMHDLSGFETWSAISLAALFSKK